MNLKILDGRSEFYQWDLNQKLLIDDDLQVEEINFTCIGLNYSLVVHSKNNIVEVPNILLQLGKSLYVYALREDKTKAVSVFDVIQRAKPDGYVYSETETKTWKELDARILELEAIDHPTPLTNLELFTLLEE